MVIAPTPANRGWLKNGNPPGDYCAAPRCGAKTRLGRCCGQPAMPNGRCRLHGGKSTGARTAAGRARCARARRTHDFYSAEIVALRRDARTHLRRMQVLLAGAHTRHRPAGHGVLRSISPMARRASAGIKPPMNADTRRYLAPTAVPDLAHRRSSAFIGGFESSSVAPPRSPVPAGHGVLRSFFRSALNRATRWLGLRA
jgi:hypothetical protein